jgi:hypothetical protein
MSDRKNQPGIRPSVWNMIYRCAATLLSRTRPAGQIRTRDFTRFGKQSVNAAAIPPPREYPIRAKALSPVQEMDDDAKTESI